MIWAPFAILVVWGAAFLLSLVNVVSAPGAPVEYVYGPSRLLLRAESYNFDLARGRLRLLKPTAKDRDEIVFQASSIDVSGLYGVASGNRVDVRIADLRARLIRDRQGRIAALGYFPKSQGKPSEIPYHVDLVRLNLEVLDRSSGTDWRRTVQSPRLYVEGSGERWLASGTVDLSQSGSARLWAEGGPGGKFLEARSAGLELGDLFQRFRPDLSAATHRAIDALSVSRLHAVGRLAATWGRKNRPDAFASHLVLAAKDFAWRGWVGTSDLSFTGDLSADRIAGDLALRQGPRAAKFFGEAGWSNRAALAGNLELSQIDSAALGSELRKRLPPQSSFSGGAFRGLVAWRDGEDARFRGSGSLGRLGLQGQTIENAAFDGQLSPSQGFLTVSRASVRGAGLVGQVNLDPKSKQVSGFAQTLGPIAIKPLIASLGWKPQVNLEGDAQAALLLSGVIDRPKLSTRLNARGSIGFAKLTEPIDGEVSASLHWDQGLISIDRALFDSPKGAVGAEGLVDPLGRLAIHLGATGIELDELFQDMEGSLVARADVGGTLKNPLLMGRAEALGAVYQNVSIPIAESDFELNPKRFLLSDIRAISGAGEATGEVEYRLADGQLKGSGEAKGIQLADFGVKSVAGSIDVVGAKLQGTADHLVASADLNASSAVLGGVKVDRAVGRLSLNANQVRIDDVQASAADGQVTGSAVYDLKAKRGVVNFDAEQLQLSGLLAAYENPEVVAAGKVSGQGTARFEPKGLADAKASGKFEEVQVNGALIGDGPFNVGLHGDQATGGLLVGGLDSFLEIKNASYDLKSKTLSADVDAFNLEASNLYQIAKPSLGGLDPDLLDRLEKLSGKLLADVTVAGTTDDLRIEGRSVSARDLKLGEEPLGQIDAGFSRQGKVWRIQNFGWKRGDTQLTVQGRIDPDGELALDGDLYNFNGDELAIADARFAGLNGKADLHFLAQGQTKSPEIQASLLSDKVSLVAGGEQRLDFGLNLDSIRVSASKPKPEGGIDGGIEVSGDFTYHGIKGLVSAQVPFAYPGTIPGDQPLNVSLQAPERSLASLAEFLPGIDSLRSEGSLQGAVTITGYKDSLRADGKIALSAPKVVFKDQETQGRGVEASILFAGDQLSLLGHGASTKGGAFDLEATSKLADFGTMLTYALNGDAEKLLDSQISGHLDAQNLRYAYQSKDRGSLDATLLGKIKLGGTVRRPSLAGSLTFVDTNVILPSVYPEAKESGPPPIDPTFAIDLNIDDHATVRATSTTLDLSGSGKLAGSLANPNFLATLNVENGSIRLPTALVNIDPDGTIQANYQGGPGSQASVSLDMTGRTVLTALRNESVERYDITLTMTGDLLKENGVNLTASSDPPDLSQDRILGLLGQADLLQSLTANSSSQDSSRQIRGALTGIATPLIFSPLTTKLAAGLGLQYLSVDYNAYEQATVSFAKALGKRLVFEGRRQVGSPLPGLRPAFDLSLHYRLPFKGGLLSRTSVSAGIDQDRPWKLSVEYSTRF